jgi:hypothetical protein
MNRFVDLHVRTDQGVQLLLGLLTWCYACGGVNDRGSGGRDVTQLSVAP